MNNRKSANPSSGIPRHTRERETFTETFHVEGADVIRAMDRQGDDVPNQVPANPILLQRMGLAREAIPVTLVDPFDSDGRVQLSCAVEAHVELRPEQRGIHVSRIGDLLAQLTGEVFTSLAHYAAAVGERIRRTQACTAAEVRVGAVLSYLERVDGVKDKESIEHLKLGATAHLGGDRATRSTSIGFNHITACPCVQQTFKHALVEGGQDRPKPDLPLLTHSQRCATVLTIGGEGDPPPLALLLASIDRVVVRSQNTLPREFELLNVHRAHARPQFLEDVLRDLLRAVHQQLKTSHPGSTIAIESTSMESIHDFDISGAVRYSVDELNRLFPG